jgi:hypothetical protein
MPLRDLQNRSDLEAWFQFNNLSYLPCGRVKANQVGRHPSKAEAKNAQ